MSNVLIITGDPIGKKIAGPAIRAWNMAVQLSESNNVKLITLTGTELVQPPFDIIHIPPGDNEAFNPLEKWADVIIFQGHAMLVFPALAQSSKILVVDVYDPMHIEQLEQSKELERSEWIRQVSDATVVLNQQLLRGDFFLCASERQRFFWLGQIAALGRINPLTYEHDPDLSFLIALVPFGLSSVEPVHEKNVMRGVIDGINTQDKILIWSGGLYNWFDPLTLIRAVGLVSQKHPEVKLFFQGTKHPHPGVPEMEIIKNSRDLATQLEINGRNVFFNSSWVDFDERQNYLLEADAGVSIHHNHIETTFSFRTRILDYLWAGLPMVVTEGDYFAELVSTHQLGVVVKDNDPQELSRAIEKVLFDEEFRSMCIANIQKVRQSFFWETALEPLIKFVNNPHHAGDIDAQGENLVVISQEVPTYHQYPRWRMLLIAAKNSYKKDGLSGLARKVRSWIRRR